MSAISRILKQGAGRIQHYFSSGNEHSVHSPFVFSLLTEAIYNRSKEPVFSKIEQIRGKLLKDFTVVQVTDLGAGSSFDGRLKKRTVSEITRKFAKSPAHCRFLYRITSFLQPKTMIELGTSLGISTMYQSAGNPSGRMITMEGCPETAALARKNFMDHDYNYVECITGNFDDTLPELLKKLDTVDYVYIDGNHTYAATVNYFRQIKNHIHKTSVIIFDDIYWSDGMKQAWNEIKKDSQVTISLDFYQFGVVFFNPDFTKQNFILRM